MENILWQNDNIIKTSPASKNMYSMSDMELAKFTKDIKLVFSLQIILA